MFLVSYTVLMFVKVLEGQSANVGVSSEFQYRVLIQFQYGVTSTEHTNTAREKK